jgi:hypothetical protein
MGMEFPNSPQFWPHCIPTKIRTPNLLGEILITIENHLSNSIHFHFFSMLKFPSNLRDQLQSFLKILCLIIKVLKCNDQCHNSNLKVDELKQQRLNIKIGLSNIVHHNSN